MKEKEPIRILHIVTSMNIGGIENFIMNTYRNIDRTRIKFDFLKHRNTHDFFDDEIKSLGGRIYTVPAINPLKQGKYNKEVSMFFRHNKDIYPVVHSHINSYSSFPLRIAKKAGIPVRIAHAHAYEPRIVLDFKSPIRGYARKTINGQITDAFACSNAAGKWLFGKRNYQCIPNSIESLKFRPDEEIRMNMRNKLGVSDAYVIGMVANFGPIKNHRFILRVFSKVLEKVPNSYLVLVGDGRTRKDTEDQAKALELSDRIIFTGQQKNVNEHLQTFDVFVLPSLTEGFAISVLEAETMGLPCVLSTGVPSNVKIFEEMNTSFLSLEDENLWVEKLVSLKDSQKRCWTNEVSETMYDAKKNAEWFMNFYEDKYNQFVR